MFSANFPNHRGVVQIQAPLLEALEVDHLGLGMAVGSSKCPKGPSQRPTTNE